MQNINKYLIQLFICCLFVSTFAQQIDATLESEAEKTGWLICVPENLRHELVYNGFPQDAIFAYQGSKKEEMKWCVVQVDNTAEIITQGVETLVKSILGATATTFPLDQQIIDVESIEDFSFGSSY